MTNATHIPEFKGKPYDHNNSYKNSIGQCTFCHRSDHTVNLYYPKHGHTNLNKNKSTINALNSESFDKDQAIVETEVASSTSKNSLIYEEKYDQLASSL